MNPLRALFVAVVLMSALPAVHAGSVLAPQVNREGGITVKVTPGKLLPSAATWEFEVVFDTHTAALTGDPAQFAVLVDRLGRTHAPLSWDGDPPGSHHRKGTLRFRAPDDFRNGGGTTPGTEEVGGVGNKLPRATQGAVAEARSGAIELRLNGVGGVATRSFRWSVR